MEDYKKKFTIGQKYLAKPSKSDAGETPLVSHAQCVTILNRREGKRRVDVLLGFSNGREKWVQVLKRVNGESIVVSGLTMIYSVSDWRE